MLHNLQFFHWTRVYWTRLNIANVISEHACVLNACSLNKLENSNISSHFQVCSETCVKLPVRVQRKFSSVFSESITNWPGGEVLLVEDGSGQGEQEDWASGSKDWSRRSRDWAGGAGNGRGEGAVTGLCFNVLKHNLMAYPIVRCSLSRMQIRYFVCFIGNRTLLSFQARFSSSRCSGTYLRSSAYQI